MEEFFLRDLNHLTEPIFSYIFDTPFRDNISQNLRTYLKIRKLITLEPGSPWENGYIESFNGKMRDELLNGEIFYTLKEARILIEMWRKEYNTIRPHSSLGYRPPVPETIMVPTTQFQLLVLT